MALPTNVAPELRLLSDDTLAELRALSQANLPHFCTATADTRSGTRIGGALVTQTQTLFANVPCRLTPVRNRIATALEGAQPFQPDQWVLVIRVGVELPEGAIATVTGVEPTGVPWARVVRIGTPVGSRAFPIESRYSARDKLSGLPFSASIITMVTPLTGLAAVGNLRFRSAGALGTSAVGMAGTAGPSYSLTKLRSDLTDAALPGVYTRDGVRLSTAGTVACVDDARCSTTTGRLLIPRVGGSYVNLGNQAAALDGLTKLTILARLTPQVLAVFSTIAARFAGNDNLSPFILRFESGSNKLQFAAWDGAATQFSNSAAPVATAGADIWIALVYDGTQVGAARSRFGSVAPGSAIVTANGNVATLPPSLAAPASGTTNLVLGAASTGSGPLQAPLDTIGMYIGSALTDGQINTEIAANCSGANHRYTFDGDLTDSGVTGGWNGAAVGTGLTYCSDDVRWGGILMGGGGGANPTWDAVNGEVVFDGVSQYLKGVGGLLAGITDNCGLALVSTTGTSGASTNTLCELGDATPNNIIAHRNASGSLLRTQALGNTTTIDQSIAGLAGQRVFHARRTNGGANTTQGAEIGAQAEFTSAVASSPQTAALLVVGASRAASAFLDIRWRGLVVYKGNYAGKQAMVNLFALYNLGATL